MNLTKSISQIAVILIALLLPGCGKSAADSTEQQRAASVLFEQYETVFYVTGALLSTSGGYRRLSKQDTNTVRAPFAYLLEGLDSMGKQGSTTIFENTDAALVGAKDFRSPVSQTGLGDVHSRFCYVIVLGKRSRFDLGKVADKSAVMSSAGASTWKWSVKGGEGHPEPYTYYAAQIAQFYLLISNDVDDLHALSSKLSASDASSKVGGILGWTTLSQHPVWGYRRYRHAELNKTAAGTLEVTSDTRALAFFADPKQKIGILRLFSRTADTASKINATRMLLPLKPAGAGVWETTIPLTGDQKSSDQMFAVMSWFGFGVYV